MDVLQLKPEAINTDFLKQFPDFQEITKKSRKNRASLSGLRRGIISHGSPQGTPLQSFQSREKPFVGEGFMPSRLNHPETKNHNPIFTSLNENPYEAIESLYQTLRQSLAADLLEKIKRVSPAFFEQLVVDVLVAMGYGGSQKDAAQTLGRSGDGGVDGIIKEDKLGLDVIYIQAKRWENPVGRPEIQGFAGSLEGFRAKKGVFMTTSRFTKEAREYVERIASRIILIEGQPLAELMIDFNVGTSEYQRYIVKKLDADYFEEE
jgi:restriction endonuclease Mrr